ncbi:MAG: HAD-IA family hydrolase [Actinomycetota bacterium]
MSDAPGVTHRFDAVLFDLDHTLLDSDTSLSEAYVAATASVGLADPESLRARFAEINDALWREVEQGRLCPDDVKTRRFEQLLEVAEVVGDRTALASQMAEAFVVGLIEHGELYDGALELLDAVSDRPTALVTNGIGRVQRGRLERLGIGDAFDAVVISGELDVAKPDPRIFDRALSSLGDPARSTTAMVGDNWGSDVVGASAAGLQAVWFDRHGATPPDEPAGVVRCDTLAEVQRVLTR